MSTVTELQSAAVEIASNIQQRASEREKELAKLKEAIARIEAELDAANLALKRIKDFRPQIGGQFQCPQCWIALGKRSDLSPVGGGTNELDFFRCHQCNLDISVSAK